MSENASGTGRRFRRETTNELMHGAYTHHDTPFAARKLLDLRRRRSTRPCWE